MLPYGVIKNVVDVDVDLFIEIKDRSCFAAACSRLFVAHFSGWFGVVVTAVVASTKVSYVEPS